MSDACGTHPPSGPGEIEILVTIWDAWWATNHYPRAATRTHAVLVYLQRRVPTRVWDQAIAPIEGILDRLDQWYDRVRP